MGIKNFEKALETHYSFIKKQKRNGQFAFFKKQCDDSFGFS